ncbi:PHD-zinc-finger like domain/PHD-like zinc-binding domain containing protein, putative [Angomonas deanei]|uniref:PHD-zinc-finger like domain/PHD-like zinc-binding domain containing protein, putative n=1 Tax=Angomonas deanei TaxID=59799 RepID=A0A7G2CEG9_9TRYP|nr:PHD-zinc-finger like domain/PHD-like zinc-binding domain containing protein, putative [Angomonas deanei]
MFAEQPLKSKIWLSDPTEKVKKVTFGHTTVIPIPGRNGEIAESTSVPTCASSPPLAESDNSSCHANDGVAGASLAVPYLWNETDSLEVPHSDSSDGACPDRIEVVGDPDSYDTSPCSGGGPEVGQSTLDELMQNISRQCNSLPTPDKSTISDHSAEKYYNTTQDLCEAVSEVIGMTPVAPSTDSIPTQTTTPSAARRPRPSGEGEIDGAVSETGPQVRRRLEEDIQAEPTHCILCGQSLQHLTIGADAGKSVPFTESDGYSFHVACALWCPEVYFSTKEGKLVNVAEAVERGQLIKCAKCRRTGATVGCIEESCQLSYHLPCAIEANNVKLNTDCYELCCTRHSP